MARTLQLFMIMAMLGIIVVDTGDRVIYAMANGAAAEYSIPSERLWMFWIHAALLMIVGFIDSIRKGRY